jgi:fused signal recognition particle receptor
MLFWKKKKKEDDENIPEDEPVESAREEEPAQSDTDEPEIAPIEKATQEAVAPIEEDVQPQPEEEPESKPLGLFAKLRQRLSRTQSSIRERTAALFLGGIKLDDAGLEELEEVLLSADVGMQTTLHLVEGLRQRAKKQRPKGDEGAWALQNLKELALEELAHGDPRPCFADTPPTIVLVVGVNGVGKTTAIGKMAKRLMDDNKKVMMIAADTFRAAAAEQLIIWAERAGCPIVRAQDGADPASVVYDGLARARKEKADVVLIDTAGRLHTKTHLMAELSKINRVIARDNPGAPHEILLVIDASTGQNGLTQAKVFTEATGVTGVVLTKLDGTAKGGVTLAIHREMGIPVKWIGVGEKIDDLEPFNPEAFVEAIFSA